MKKNIKNIIIAFCLALICTLIGMFESAKNLIANDHHIEIQEPEEHKDNVPEEENNENKTDDEEEQNNKDGEISPEPEEEHKENIEEPEEEEQKQGFVTCLITFPDKRTQYFYLYGKLGENISLKTIKEEVQKEFGVKPTLSGTKNYFNEYEYLNTQDFDKVIYLYL